MTVEIVEDGVDAVVTVAAAEDKADVADSVRTNIDRGIK